MDKCVIDLYRAVTQVDPKYYQAIGRRRRNDERYLQFIEHSFSAELYHQFRTIMDEPLNHDYYNCLVLNFDITKASVGVRPDLVLHRSQSNRVDQRMFIEVKTDPNSDLTREIQKLFDAISGPLNFSQSVLITVNRSTEAIGNLVINQQVYIENARLTHQIFFINIRQAGRNRTISINSLNEILL